MHMLDQDSYFKKEEKTDFHQQRIQMANYYNFTKRMVGKLSRPPHGPGVEPSVVVGWTAYKTDCLFMLQSGRGMMKNIPKQK